MILNYLLFALLFSMHVSAFEGSDALKEAICKEVSSVYGTEANRSERSLTSHGVVISNEDCQNFDFHHLDEEYSQVGSKKVLTSIEASIQSQNLGCFVMASRSVNVHLDSKDTPTIVVGDWSVWLDDSIDPGCVVLGTSEIESFNFDQSQHLLKKIDPKKAPVNLYMPEHTELGEPDDSTAGIQHTIYEYRIGPNFYGYVVEYWYANSEGPWATQYILKYNTSGQLLGHLIENSSYDFCEFPWNDDSRPEECAK